MDRAAIVGILKGSSTFRCLAESEIGDLCVISTEQNLERNEVLLSQGSNSHFFHLMLQGRMKVFTCLPSGREVILNFVVPGDVIGPLATFGGRPSIATVQAASASNVLSADRKDFEAFLMVHPALHIEITKLCASAARQFYHRFVDVASTSAVERTATTLLHLSNRCGNEVLLSREELACMVGTTVETTIRITNSLKRAGIVACCTRNITILDKKRLLDICEGKLSVLYFPSKVGISATTAIAT